jgi:hypothetical protein
MTAKPRKATPAPAKAKRATAAKNPSAASAAARSPMATVSEPVSSAAGDYQFQIGPTRGAKQKGAK